MLFRGKIVDVMRRTTDGWLRGTIEIDGLDADEGHRVRIAFQNEFVVAWKDEAVIATVPDLICLMDSASGDAIGTETVRYGQRVTVIALPAPAILTSERGLKKVGPRAFGYDLDFLSVFAEARPMMRIGIDVGGTNTDAVMIEAGAGAPCRQEPDHRGRHERHFAGRCGDLLRHRQAWRCSKIGAVMIGTTHFTNAVVQRRDLGRVAAVRIGLPAAATLPPFVDWPADLRELVRGPVHMVRGGYEVDGRPIVPFDRAGMRAAAQAIAASGVRCRGGLVRVLAAQFRPRERRPARSCARNARRSPSPCRTSWAASVCSRARTCRC